MKKKFIKPLIACIAVGLVLIGVFTGYKYFFKKSTNVMTNRQITATAQKINMQVKIQGTGSVYAGTSKDITSNNSGTLKDLNVKLGQTVSAGDKLFTIDSDTLRQNVTTAENNLKKQKLTLAGAKTQNEIDIDNISVSNAQTQLDNANEQLGKMTVSSPINGVITAVNSTNGDNIQSGKAVVSVADPASMKIKVSVDELNISKVKVGQSTEITFSALEGKKYEGVVDTVAEVGTTTNNATNYEVVVSIKNPTDIKLGMNATVNILVESKDNALTIPKEALIEQDGKKYVRVSNGNGNTEDSSGQSSNIGTENPSSPVNNGNNKGTQNNGKVRTGNNQNQTKQSAGTASRGSFNGAAGGKLVEVSTGIENDDYVEIVSGVQEGQEILINLPTSTSTNSSSNRSGFSMGGMSGGFSSGNRAQSGGQGR